MFFLESPWPILIVGLVLELPLVIALFQTRKGKLLWAIGGVALLVLAGLLVERYTVTDTKLVRKTLEAVATGLKANSKEKVYDCIVTGPDGDPARKRTDDAFSIAEFFEISIRNLDVTINYRASPPTAEAEFTVVVHGRLRAGEMRDLGDVTRPVRIKVELRKQSGRWLIYGDPKHDVQELGGKL